MAGRGVERDFKSAADWFRSAADEGLDSAQFELAMLYLEGRGVEKSAPTAFRWLTKSAKQGNAEAEACHDEAGEK